MLRKIKDWWRALRADVAEVAALRHTVEVMRRDTARLRSERDAARKELRRVRERILTALRAEIGSGPDLATPAALGAFVRSMRQDAEKWRALAGCARIRIIGSARYGQPDMHLGLDLWSIHPDSTSAEAAQALEDFVDVARDVKALGPEAQRGTVNLGDRA